MEKPEVDSEKDSSVDFRALCGINGTIIHQHAFGGKFFKLKNPYKIEKSYYNTLPPINPHNCC